MGVEKLQKTPIAQLELVVFIVLDIQTCIIMVHHNLHFSEETFIFFDHLEPFSGKGPSLISLGSLWLQSVRAVLSLTAHMVC